MSGTFDESAESVDIFALILFELRKSFSTLIKGLDGKLDHIQADRFFYAILAFLGGVQHTDNIPEKAMEVWKVMGDALDLSRPPANLSGFIIELPSGEKLYRAFDIVINMIGRLAIESAEASSGKPIPKGGVAAVDRKSFNSSGIGGEKPVSMLNMADSRLGWITCNGRIGDKGESEADATVKMIQSGRISRESVLACDAASTCKKVIDALLAEKLNYCLAVKGNEKELFQDAKGAFARVLDQLSIEFHGFLEKIGHSTATCAPSGPPRKEEGSAWDIDECVCEESPVCMAPVTKHISAIGCASRHSRPVPLFVCEVDGGFAAVKRTVDMSCGATIVSDHVLLLTPRSVGDDWGGSASSFGLASKLVFPDKRGEAVVGATRYYLTSLKSVEEMAYCIRRRHSVERAQFVLETAFGDDWSKSKTLGNAEAFHLARKIAMALVSCYRAARFKCGKSYDSAAEWIGTDHIKNLGAAFCPESYPSKQAG
jgi:hypothetical protein